MNTLLKFLTLAVFCAVTCKGDLVKCKTSADC